MADMDFTLVVACFNEERVLEDSLAQLEAVFAQTTLRLEIVFVDDKSTDGTVAMIKKTLASRPSWRLIEHASNQGRGAAVDDGIRAARATIVGFIDIDLSTSPWYLPRLIHEVRNGADIASAMRMYKLKPRTLLRWVLSKGYRFVMRLVLNCDLQDTETGCKVFRRERILPILDSIKEKHWFWDTEIMSRSYVAGYAIREVPTVFVRDGLYSTVRILRDSMDYLVNLFRFRRELQRMRRR